MKQEILCKYETQNLMKDRKLAKMCPGGWLSPKVKSLKMVDFQNSSMSEKPMFLDAIAYIAYCSEYTL